MKAGTLKDKMVNFNEHINFFQTPNSELSANDDDHGSPLMGENGSNQCSDNSEDCNQTGTSRNKSSGSGLDGSSGTSSHQNISSNHNNGSKSGHGLKAEWFPLDSHNRDVNLDTTFDDSGLDDRESDFADFLRSVEEAEANSENNNPPESSTFVRKSSRVTSIPKKFDDYIIEGKYKYGVEKVVNYSHLSNNNKCFVSNLNKVVEPTSYDEACSDPKWITAMNEEMEALHLNNTWSICDLPKGRKPVGCRWIYKVK